MKKLLYVMALAIGATFFMGSESKASATEYTATLPAVEMTQVAEAVAVSPIKFKYVVLDDNNVAILGYFFGEWHLIAII